MPGAHTGIIDMLRYTAVGAEILAVGRIALSGPARRFPRLLGLLGLDLGLSLAILPLPTSSPLYRNLWLISQPLIMIALAAAAYEVLATVTEGYSSARRTRSGMLRFVVPIGAVAAVAASWSDLLGATWRSPLLQAAFLARRAESISIAAALVSANVIFAIAPAPARRNAVANARIFGVYVTAQAVGYFAMLHDYVRAVQIALALVSLGCFAAWIVAIRTSGDELPVRPPRHSLVGFDEALRRMDESL